MKQINSKEIDLLTKTVNKLISFYVCVFLYSINLK